MRIAKITLIHILHLWVACIENIIGWGKMLPKSSNCQNWEMLLHIMFIYEKRFVQVFYFIFRTMRTMGLLPMMVSSNFSKSRLRVRDVQNIFLKHVGGRWNYVHILLLLNYTNFCSQWRKYFPIKVGAGEQKSFKMGFIENIGSSLQFHPCPPRWYFLAGYLLSFCCQCYEHIHISCNPCLPGLKYSRYFRAQIAKSLISTIYSLDRYLNRSEYPDIAFCSQAWG